MSFCMQFGMRAYVRSTSHAALSLSRTSVAEMSPDEIVRYGDGRPGQAARGGV